MPKPAFIHNIALYYFLFTLFPLQAYANSFSNGLVHMQKGDYAKAYCLWQPLAEQGHPEAQYNIGWLYANGNGLNVDIREAVSWWQKAATNGHLDAQFSIGLAYTTGEGLKRDRLKAFYWFLTAAKSGHDDARDIVKRLVQETSAKYYAEFPEIRDIEWLTSWISITGKVVNVRSGPGTDQKIVHQAKAGERYQKIGQQNDWLEIRLNKNNETGWIYSKLVKIHQ